MLIKITKIGNSKGFIISKEIIRKLGIEINDEFELTFDSVKNEIKLKPIKSLTDKWIENFEKHKNEDNKDTHLDHINYPAKLE